MGGLVGVLDIETLASVQEQWRQCSCTDHNFARELWSDSHSDTLILWIRHNNLQHWCWVESRAEYLFQSFNELEILKLFEWRLQHNKPWTMGYWWHLTNENQNEHRAGFQHIAALTNIHIWGGVTMLWCYEWHSWHWWRGWTRWAAGPRDTDVTLSREAGLVARTLIPLCLLLWMRAAAGLRRQIHSRYQDTQVMLPAGKSNI